MSTLWRFDDRRGSIARETDISAECAPTEENPWVPRAGEDQGGAEGVETPAGQGAQTADRLTGRFPRRERLTTGSDFQALFQRGKRVDRPSMTILWCESVDARRVGFREPPGPARGGEEPRASAAARGVSGDARGRARTGDAGGDREAVGAQRAVRDACQPAARRARRDPGSPRVTRAVLAALTLYQRFVSPLLPRACRFAPTCSEYARLAVLEHGAACGGWLSHPRLLRCPPFPS